ncbi:aromatic amino acid transaminase [Caulobacter sp.]|uniref:aromatic amino acid transaminase n=1 Tax=Caulobacter sp. TaxID=78 RepID=UPI0031D57AEA
MLDRLAPSQTDSLMELGRLMRADPRTDKIDLGVGTYRDEHGAIPIMAAVKAAENDLVRTQTSKGYVGPAGDELFARLLQDALLGPTLSGTEERTMRIQTPGGTGALRLALQIIAQANPAARVWIATPTWPAHVPLARACGLEVRTYRHLDTAGGYDAAAADAALDQAEAGDVILLHGCCHNPTGVDVTSSQWPHLAKRLGEKGLIPLIDLAYPGLGESLQGDVEGVRTLLAACPEALVALSCSKSFGLYRDRAGILLGLASSPAVARNLAGVAASQARLLWSNPPDHGAAVTRAILSSAELTPIWRAELDAMRARVNGLRASLAALDFQRLDLSRLARQRGMFAMLPLTPEEVVRLREEHGLYMDISGRINVAGLNPANFDRFATALAAIDRH